ncbi:MAG: hypothetical protein ACQERF_09025 [Actinomycetota bacterium]
MGTVVKPNTFESGNTISSAQVNANFDTIYTLVNGLLDDANLANGAVTENKLADGAVTSTKIANGTIINADISAAAAIQATKIGAGNVSDTEFGYLDGVTSAIQTQLNGKQATLGAGDVTTTLIGDGQVTADKLQAFAVGVDPEMSDVATTNISASGTATVPAGLYFVWLNGGPSTVSVLAGTGVYVTVLSDTSGGVFVISDGTNVKVYNNSGGSISYSRRRFYP